jgi:hypothetical protein
LWGHSRSQTLELGESWGSFCLACCYGSPGIKQEVLGGNCPWLLWKTSQLSCA